MSVLIQLFSLWIALFGLAGCVRLEDFYPFGAAAGDQELARADDGFSAPLQLKERFPYYDREESKLYVSSSLFLPLSLFSTVLYLSKNCACIEGLRMHGVNIIGCVCMQLARRADCKLQFILYTEATFKLHAHTVGWKVAMWQAVVDEATAKLALIGISEASGMSTNRDAKNLLIHICQLKIKLQP